MKNVGLVSSLGLVLCASIWGFAFVVVKDSFRFVGPYWMVGIRFAIAAVVLALVCIPRFKKMTSKIFRHGIMLGCFLGAGYLTQTVGCQYTTAGKNAFLTTFYVILIPLLSWPILKKKPEFHVYLAALMSMTGIALLALGGESGKWWIVNRGDVLTLICGLFFALHIVFGAKYVAGEDVIVLTFLQFAVASVMGTVCALVSGEIFPVRIFSDPGLTFPLLYLGLLSSLLCFLLQNSGLKYVPSAFASLFLSLESVFGVLFSALFLRESLTSRMWFGCALIFAAILVAEVLPGFSELLRGKKACGTGKSQG